MVARGLVLCSRCKAAGWTSEGGDWAGSRKRKWRLGDNGVMRDGKVGHAMSGATTTALFQWARVARQQRAAEGHAHNAR